MRHMKFMTLKDEEYSSNLYHFNLMPTGSLEDIIDSSKLNPMQVLDAGDRMCPLLLCPNSNEDNLLDFQDYTVLSSGEPYFWGILESKEDSKKIVELKEIQENCILQGEVLSQSEVESLFRPRFVIPTPPDISEGLGRSRENQDLNKLEKFLIDNMTLMVYREELFEFIQPCWKHLSPRACIVRQRELLDSSDCGDMLTTREYQKLYNMLLSNPQIQQSKELEPPPHTVNLLDGTLNLLTGEVYPHKPEDGFFTYLNVTAYEVCEASYGSVFENFVAQIDSQNLNVRQQLLELVALAMTGYEAKVFYVLLGASNTGKTQFGRFLEELLGREQVVSMAGVHDFSNRFTTSTLEGKMLATCLDLPDSPLPSIAVGVIKQIVGDDPIKVEAKYKNSRTIYRKPLLLFAGNHPLRITNISNEKALLNRMVVIPFSNPVSEREATPQLYKSLLEESAYIVAQAMKAYQDLFQRKFAVTRVPIPEEYASRDAREGAYSIERFISEYCVLGEDRWVTTEDLYSAYLNYAEEQGWPGISKINFSRLLAEKLSNMPNVTVQKRIGEMQKRGYCGIGLSSEI